MKDGRAVVVGVSVRKDHACPIQWAIELMSEAQSRRLQARLAAVDIRVDVQTRVGHNIRRLRQQQMLSQEELANRADIHNSYLSGLERGLQNPTIRVLVRIATALHVQFHSLWSQAELAPVEIHMDVPKLVGNNIQRLRHGRMLSKNELARRADVDNSYLSSVERGFQNPTIRILGSVATALGVDIQELFRSSEKETKDDVSITS